jgi:hypothetical protein
MWTFRHRKSSKTLGSHSQDIFCYSFDMFLVWILDLECAHYDSHWLVIGTFLVQLMPQVLAREHRLPGQSSISFPGATLGTSGEVIGKRVGTKKGSAAAQHGGKRWKIDMVNNKVGNIGNDGQDIKQQLLFTHMLSCLWWTYIPF